MKHDRNFHISVQQASRGRQKRAMSVQQALEWAFRVEHAQLESPEPTDPERGQGFGVSLEYALVRQAALGCKVDGGRYKLDSYTHPDAEVIAAVVAGLPGSLGGKRMAIRVAELARAGITPDWMPGAVPRCVPVEMKRNRHGNHATTVVVGSERVLSRGKWRTVELRACPVMFRPDSRLIEAARRAYNEWWQALVWIRDGLISGDMLRELTVTSVTPKAKPWARD
jgi:hypothetical protein